MTRKKIIYNEGKELELCFEENLWFLPASDATSLLHLYSAGITYPDPSYRISRPEGNFFYVLEYIVAGCGSLRVGDNYFTPRAGDVYLIKPFHDHEYHSSAHEPWKKLWFNIGGPLIDHLTELYGLQGTTLFRNCPLETPFTRGLEIIRTRTPQPYLELGLQLHRIFAGIHDWQFNHPEIRKSPEGLCLKEYIDSHWRENITLELLCRLIKRSPAQTLRIFQRNWQSTPYAYLQQQRLKFAKQYLVNTGYSIKMIADLAGFKDEFYFSNWFKQKTGSSPSLYRRNGNQKEYSDVLQG